MTTFLDTNVLVAAADRRDEHHLRAAELLRMHGSAEGFSTDHVLIEAWHVIKSRAGYDTAERFLAELLAGPIRIETPTALDFHKASMIGERWADQRFDLVDRTSFAVMERLGCGQAATFDDDFAIYRYGPDRRNAFTVLR